MKPDPCRPPPTDWWTEHPWFYIYTVISAMLLALLTATYFANWLKALLP